MKITRSRRMSIDISWLLFVIVVILTGQLTNYLVLLVIMCWHECGHFLTALYFKWPIKELRLFMFGCVMETDAFLMRPLKEQWLVVLAGPLQHVAIFFACLFLKQSAQPMTVIDFAMRANVTLVCFNLLPIWPLDGGKIIYLLCNLRLPFKKKLSPHVNAIYSQYLHINVGLYFLWSLFFRFSVACRFSFTRNSARLKR
ncbi:site-2 protease family protein [Halolactibacillus sp. JCM 19043]|uniref:site-2 protease family protein n=1 Tax=Halolactibacillus sp. JCM 19043 TaxID=1460638 RepID=UPI00078509CB|nr:site-2 protease family protein [Halolactibacillus sp. JCM 19043]